MKKDRLISLVALGIGLVGLVVPFIWKTMPDLVSYPILVVGVLLIVWGSFHLWRDRRRSVPNIEGAPLNVRDWQHHDDYFVWVAACLWVPVQPEPKIPQGHPAYSALQHLKGAFGVNMTARVSAEELKRHAFTRQEFPEFLFPDRVKT